MLKSNQVLCEYDGSGGLLRKFIYGTGIDEPIRMEYTISSADIDGNGSVGEPDLRILAAAWFTTLGDLKYNSTADLNADGHIDNYDTDLLSAHWNTSGAGSAVTTYYYYHYDGSGNVIALSNPYSRLIEEYKYDVFGNSDYSSVANPYLFTGRRYDAETGLYYYRARYYNVAIGRFLQTDPIGYADGINWYAYCGNNPVNFVDPFGLCRDPGVNPEDISWFDVVVESLWTGVKAGVLHDDAAIRSANYGVPNSGTIGSAAGYLGETAGVVTGVSVIGKQVVKQGLKQTIKQTVKHGTDDVISIADDVARLPKNKQKAIKSLQKQIQQHQTKLKNFKANPKPRPGTENLSKQIQQKTIDGRIKHLEQEIKTFQNNIDKIKKGG